MDIERIKSLAESIKKDYVEQLNGTRRWLQDYRKEVQAFKEYRGREVFELLQNADDACSEIVEISVDTKENTLTIMNSGPQTVLFDEEGIQSIMLSDMSPKKGKRMIGAKGLGFRSVLNWTDKVQIISGNVSLKFGEDIVKCFWEKWKSDIVGAETYEKEAKNDGREVPLAVLALPEINLTPDSSRSTSVILTYDHAVEQSILDNLKLFRPEVLLFLKHVRVVSVYVDGSKVSEYANQFVTEKDGINEYSLNDARWVMSIVNDKTDKGVSYEAACAFCLDHPEKTYEIYSHFPTKVFFPFPCILHASLELDSSRNSLLPDNPENRDMMLRLAERIIKVAEYLKGNRHDWYPYLMMRPDCRQDNKNEYVRLLSDNLLEISRDGKYVPTLDGNYATDEGYYHYSDELYHFLKQDKHAETVFPALRLSDSPVDSLCRLDPDAISHMHEYSTHLADQHDLEKVAELVSLLMRCPQYHDLEFNILPDENFKIVNIHQGAGEEVDKAYINTGLVVNDIPDFKKIRYVNKRFVAIMEEILGISSEHKERELADKLNSVTNVIATDVAAITNQLLPVQSDKDLPHDQKQELIICLFKHYIDNLHDSPNVTVNRSRVRPFLMSEAREWVDAKSLVFLDERFPSGKKLSDLGIDHGYGQKDAVLFPEFLCLIDGSSPELIEAFYAYLGVNAYFKRVGENFADDRGYVAELEGYMDHALYEQVAANCAHYKVKDYNIAEIAEADFFKGLSLNDVLSVTCSSGYINLVCGSQVIMWFKSKCHSVEVGMSYAAYCMKQIDAVRQLQYYVIDEDAWLPGHEPSEKLVIGNEYRHKELLRSLGAKRSMSEFSVDELYDAINNISERFEREGLAQEDVVDFYLSLIHALDVARGETTSPAKPLRLICRKGDDLMVKDAHEVYYSDNNDLPADVTRTLPILLMRRRQGEMKIKAVLGCRTFKDLEVRTKDEQINEQLTSELSRYIEARKAYFLALASAGVGRRGGAANHRYNAQYKTGLSSFSLTVVSNVKCQYGAMSDFVQIEREGELLCAEEFYICSGSGSLKDAIANPRFNSSVVEALCIKLKLTGSDVADKFYRIFTSNEKELEFYRQHEIDEQLWKECEPLFDYTEEDICFWEKVFEKNGRKGFNREALRSEKMSYLQENLKISRERCVSSGNFCRYHEDQLKETLKKYSLDYYHFIYCQLQLDPDQHKNYCERQQSYLDERWIMEILNESDNRYSIFLDYDSLVKDAVAAKLECNLPVEGAESHDKITRYLDRLAENLLTQEQTSLLFFEGHDEEFERIRKEFADDDSVVDEPLDLHDTASLHIAEAIMSRPYESSEQNTSHKGKVSGKRRRNVSAARKKQLGNEAEDKVYYALQNSEDYEVGDVYSSHLAKNNAGNDGQGYDMEYRKKGEELFRCLEIKYFDGDSIILSANEYNVALSEKFKDRYDLALVSGNKITIIRAPFADDSKYLIRANDYTVRFVVGPEA